MKLLSVVFPIREEQEDAVICKLKKFMDEELGIPNSKVALHIKPILRGEIQ